MNLNDLLKKSDIDPSQVIIMRHVPQEPALRKVLPWLAAEQHALYNAYQRTQPVKVERSLQKAAFVASFIGHVPERALFVGLYAINGTAPLTHQQFWEVPEHIELKKFGLQGFPPDDRIILRFNMERTGFYENWQGKLVVGWPPPGISWWRRAENNVLPVIAVLEDSYLEADMPSWDRINLSWQELSVLPTRWKQALAQWRGIYFIYDAADGKGYVGSAYGGENLLGRWLNYSATGHGGNVLLRARNPQGFRFTILQRVSPDMDADDVIRVEGTWKERLHTRTPNGLNDN